MLFKAQSNTPTTDTTTERPNEEIASLSRQLEAARRDARGAHAELAELRARANLLGWIIYQSQQPDAEGYTKYDHPTRPDSGLSVYHASSRGRSTARRAAKSVWRQLGTDDLPQPYPGAVDYDTLEDPARRAELIASYLSEPEPA